MFLKELNNIAIRENEPDSCYCDPYTPPPPATAEVERAILWLRRLLRVFESPTDAPYIVYLGTMVLDPPLTTDDIFLAASNQTYFRAINDMSDETIYIASAEGFDIFYEYD